jgi:broad specificity phosphatase PhoE
VVSVIGLILQEQLFLTSFLVASSRDYGAYEGLLTHEIKEKNPNWSIWKDG